MKKSAPNIESPGDREPWEWEVVVGRKAAQVSGEEEH
jgi:hypothetical protein